MGGSEHRDEAKRVAREQVHDQIQEISDSWRVRDTLSPDRKSKVGKKRMPPVRKSSATTLKLNRSRRKAKKEATLALNPVILEEILQRLNLINVPNPANPNSGDRGARALESTESISTERELERQRKLQRELEKFKLNPDHAISDSSMYQILRMHQGNGGEVAALGSAFVARLETMKRRKAEERADRRTRRNALKERLEDGVILKEVQSAGHGQ